MSTQCLSQVTQSSKGKHCQGQLAFLSFHLKLNKEAAWTVTNLTSVGKPHQMKAIIDLGVLEPLARMLTCNDIKT